MKYRPIEERFTEKYEIDLETGCWLWNAASHNLGYGILRINRKNVRANRLSYKLYIGNIPQGMFVCHKCDIPACVNPKHLFLGTQKDNAQDRVLKGFTGGKKSGTYDHTVRTFTNKDGRIYTGTQYDFRKKFGLFQSHASALVTGVRTTTKSWSLIKEGE